MLDDPQHQRLRDLEKRQCDLLEKLLRMEEQHDFETRVENKMWLEREMAETRDSLQRVKTELLSITEQTLLIKEQALFAEASRLRRLGSYRESIRVWREIQDNNPSNSASAREIAALEKLDSQKVQSTDLIKRLVSRIKDVRSVFNDVVTALRQPADTAEYELLLEQTGLFLDDVLDAEIFVIWWEAMNDVPQAVGTQNVDITRLAKRVQRGEMVLFLGSGITAGVEDEAEENALTKLLARQIKYEQFNGTLSSIAEYYQLRPDYGASALLENIRSGLPRDTRQVTLYQALAKVQSPLILISATYDNLLECSFRETGKRFVELASIVHRREYEIGHVVVSFSDDSQPTAVYPEEKLSHMKFLEKGYSIIYKIRGTCGSADCGGSGDDDALNQDALTLSESSYFSFARYADRMIPSYLAKQLQNRGFLFVGYYPRDWEDRLLVNALLERRGSSQEPCYVIGATTEPLETAFWKKHNVNLEIHQLDIRELEKSLEGVGV